MTTPRRPLGRYDDPKPLSRRLLIAGASAGALLLVLFAWFGYSRFSDGRTRYGVTGYKVIDGTSVQITFEVHKDLTTSVTCALVARDRDNLTVGRKDVIVGPAERDTVQVVDVVPTTRRAATVDVSACSRPRSS
ncbi:MAG: hypothetical protein JWO12_11 [Frankiales bacterium]|nr:hypothetical protein [Frankiales bacterium]